MPSGPITILEYKSSNTASVSPSARGTKRTALRQNYYLRVQLIELAAIFTIPESDLTTVRKRKKAACRECFGLCKCKTIQASCCCVDQRAG